jgi:hypothetical protein
MTDRRSRTTLNDSVDVHTTHTIEGSLREKIAMLSDLAPTEFVLICSDSGFCRGRIFRFRAPTPLEREQWFESITDRMQRAQISTVSVSQMRWVQMQCRRKYDSQESQIGVGALIMASFVATIAEAQILPGDDSPADVAFGAIGDAFNWIFTAELAVNFCSKFLLDFFRDPWNWFDTFVVVSRYLFSSVKGGAQPLRCIRAVRIFRLFKRVPALLHLITALLQSVPKVLNAFALALIAMSIYAILAVQFFADAPREDDCAAQRECPDELFGSFSRAFFTMFQTASLDAWSDVARSLMRTTGQPALVAVFFMSFLLIVTYTLMQVPHGLSCSRFPHPPPAPPMHLCSIPRPPTSCPPGVGTGHTPSQWARRVAGAGGHLCGPSIGVLKR